MELAEVQRKAWAFVATRGHAAVHSAHVRQGMAHLASLPEEKRKELQRSIKMSDKELREELVLAQR